MPYEVLARKWRPQVFQEVIGQDHVTQTLVNAIKSHRLAHAYLFGGPRGVGKTTVARILAKAMNCEQGEPGIPCNKCRSCMEITDGSSLDVQEIDGASNRRIEEIRDLRENIKYMPSSSKYRIYIIDEVHMLTKEAFNALLKTLEEPPAHAKFIFATTETHKVPVTILSRCQRFDFKRIPPGQMINHLEKIVKDEHVEIDKSGLAIIAREAEGSMRDGESLLDQVISFAGHKVKDTDITEILGIVDRNIMFEASLSIIEGDPQNCLKIVEQIYNQGHDIKEFYRVLMEQFRSLLISLVAPQDHLLDMGKSEQEEAIRQAEIAGEEKLQFILSFLINREEVLRFTSHPRLILETIMIKLCNLGEFLSFGDLLEKIESLKKRLDSPGNIKPTGAGNVSDPAARWVSGSEGKGQQENRATSKGDQGWSDFLAFLASESKATFNVLKDWRFMKLTDQVLEIARSARSFSSGYFDDPERFNQLLKYCRDFFKRDMRIKIIGNDHPPLKAKEPPGNRRPDSEKSKHADLSPPVRDILDIFEGEIKDE